MRNARRQAVIHEDAAGSSDPGTVSIKREKINRPHVDPEEHSSQETAARRAIRSKYMALHSKINDEREDLGRVDSDTFDSVMKEIETLHESVQKPREQVADAETLLGIASTLASSVKLYSNDGITVSEFVSCLSNEFRQANDGVGNEENDSICINWRELGMTISSIFKKCNGFNTMLGPMSTEIKQRKPVIHRKRTRLAQSSQPEEVANAVEERTDTDKNMLTMFEILKSKRHVRLENLILNRVSFAQTIENLFALSFLVKDGRAEIIIDQTGSHIVSPRNAPPASSVVSGQVSYRHFVFRYDFKDWKVMIDMVPEGQELMPPRKQLSASEERIEDESKHCTQSKTPIRILSRNRGLIVQEDSVAEESPELPLSGKPSIGRRCKRKLT